MATTSQRGISLIEALVAMAVMSIGMMAYVGMQGGMRVNGDVAKQRAEAVRIAQDTVERWRAFSLIDDDADAADYAEITTMAPVEIAGETTNTTYRLTRTVADAAAGVADPRFKALAVDVAWEDRTDQTQSVRLATTIAGIPPELAGALSMPASGTPLLPVQGRHPAIPPEAVAIEGTPTSRFSPPQPPGGTVSWIFDNLSGVIVSLCSAPDACVGTSAMLLAGQVRFALTAAQPTGADAEAPPSPAQAVAVVVDRTYPAALAIDCYEQLRAFDLRYFCAVPVNPGEDPPPSRWAGRSRLAGLALAADPGDADANKFRVCRYTPVAGCHPAVGSKIWGFPGEPLSCSEPNPQTDPHTPSRLMRNADHPLDYAGVGAPLTNQNFLVIRAGNDVGGGVAADGSPATAYDCPADDPITPLLNGNTWHHQPAD